MTDDENRIEVLITKAKKGELSEKEKEEMLAIITTAENDTNYEDRKDFLDKLTDSVLDGFEQSITNLNNQITFIKDARAGDLTGAVKMALEIVSPKEKDNESK